MFRKILIAFVLLVMLAGFSYLKTKREYTKQDALYEKAKSDVASENSIATSDYENKIDSLGSVLATTSDSYETKLSDQNEEYNEQFDSLENIIDKQSAKITDLSKKQTKQTSAVSKPKPKAKSKQLSQHEKIYRYYKKRYTSLPGDLSSYEKKIALSEIREETASKFSVSLTELAKIRKEYKLNY